MNKFRKINIRYGLGYIFKSNKILGSWNVDSYEILETEYDLETELIKIREKHEDKIEKLHSKSIKYIKCVEETLRESAEYIGLIITDITNSDDGNEIDYLMNDYRNYNINLKGTEKFEVKELSNIERYVDRCTVIDGKINYSKDTITMLLNSNLGLILSSVVMTPEEESAADRQKAKEDATTKLAIKKAEFDEALNTTLIAQIDIDKFDFRKFESYLNERINILLGWEEDLNKSVMLVEKDGSQSSLDTDEFVYSDLMELILREENYLHIPYFMDKDYRVFKDIQGNHYKVNEEWPICVEISAKLVSEYGDIEADINNLNIFKMGDIDINLDKIVGILLSCKDRKLNINLAKAYGGSCCGAGGVELIDRVGDFRDELVNFIEGFSNESIKQH